MGTLLVGSVVAAVLCHGGGVAFVDTAKAAVIGRAALGGAGLALFAAPDGRVVVPLRGEDATVVVVPGGAAERWKGRTFPLFFNLPDRFYGVLPGALWTLSYPERVPLAHTVLAGLAGAWRADCSPDGLTVAIVPVDEGRATLLLVSPIEGSPTRQIALSGRVGALAVGRGGDWVAATLEGGAVEVALAGDSVGRGGVKIGGPVSCLGAGADSRDLLAGVEAGGRAELVCLRVDPDEDGALEVRFRTEVPEPLLGVAPAGGEVVALTRAELLVLSRGGKRLRSRVALDGAEALTVLPAVPAIGQPRWSDPGSQ